MKLFSLCAALLFALNPLPSIADETDNFSNRNVKLKDSAALVDEYVNNQFQKVISESNKGASCDYQVIFQNFKYVLDTNFPDISPDLKEDPRIEKKNLFLKNSIYKTSSKEVGELSPTVNVNGFTIGIDKLDHFFSTGSAYWLQYLENKNLDKTLQYGLDQEDGIWGLSNTLVKSYGDLAANYSGFTFWNQILSGKNPYLKCENSKWVINRKFKIADYIDSSWDEAINCSSYASQKMADAILTEMSHQKLSCPVSPSECQNLTKKYPANIAKYILHPVCREQKAGFYEKPKGFVEGLRGDFFTKALDFKMGNMISELKGSHKTFLDYLNARYLDNDASPEPHKAGSAK